MDDIHKEPIVHPDSLACPVALAFAKSAAPSLSGRDVLTAVIAGYEVGTRVGNAATMALFLRGLHPQGTSGTFVAAATAGRIPRLSSEHMQHAFGIAGSMGAGLMAAQEGAMVKRLHAGRTAQAGVQAALLARRGFTGISDEDAGLEAMGAPFRHACRLSLTTRDGRTFEHERLARRGSPEDTVGESEIAQKFNANVSTILSGNDTGGPNG